ncbi:MAG: hypothetical protein JWP12_312 [Bacteroidetes bacterium]|nr:hypothetical protein [Bacteroidota bacterium]
MSTTSQFRFYLDGNLVSDPLNWDDFTETIERDDTIKGLLPKYEVKLNFSGGGYEYLYSQYKQNGFCKLVELKIDYRCGGGYKTALNGYIFISDCKFNLNKCTVECDVIDDNYGARIYNNKSLKAKLDVKYSKNGVEITPAAINIMSIYSTTNTFIENCTTFQIKEVFRYLIDFMSDGKVGFESDLFTIPAGITAQTAGWLYLVTALELRLNNGDIPNVSFQEVFAEVNKKYPIAFTIISGSDGRPTMKIESEDYFYKEIAALRLNSIQDLQQSFNNELLYSSIKLGAPESDVIGSFPPIRFLAFAPEEYQVQGECNIDKVLDLTGIYIADSNIIEQLTATDRSNEQYDKEICFIESIFGAASQITNSFVTLTTPMYYNANLTNNRVAERYFVANNIAYYLGNNDQAFLATNTANQVIISAANAYTQDPITGIYSLSASSYVSFQDDSTPPNFDTTGTYDNTTAKYISPADGVYGFESVVKVSVRFVAFQVRYLNSRVRLVAELFDASGTHVSDTPFLERNYDGIQGGDPAVTDSIDFVTPVIYMPATWGVKIRIDIFNDISPPSQPPPTLYNNQTTFIITTGSTFKTAFIQNGGGIYVYKNPNNYFVSRFEFQQPLSNEKYEILKLDLAKGIEFNHDKINNKKGWIRKLSRKYATSEMNWELISQINFSS